MAFRVDVYESRGSVVDDERIHGMDFEFPNYEQASKFVEQMVLHHGKTVIVCQCERKQHGRTQNVCQDNHRQ